MKIETQPRDDHQVSMVVEIDSDTYESFKRKAARKISKETRIAGFRPGKAPYDVVLRHYGAETIENQAIEDMVNDIYPKALDESKIEPSGPGQLEETLGTDPPKFSFIVPLKPEIELCDYHSIQKEYKVDPVTEKDINNVIHRVQVNNAIAEPVEDRPAQLGDLVAVMMDAILTKPEEGESAEIIKQQPFQVVIEEENTLEENPWPFAEFTKELIGLKTDDEKKVVYTYPEDSDYENLRNKEVEFTVKIQSIKSLELPELNDEFAASLGNFESYEKLVENIRESLEQNAKQEYERKYLDELVSTIVEQSTVKYPPHILDEEISATLKSFEQNLSRQHMDVQTYLKTIQKEPKEFIEEEIRPAAVEQLERALVLQEIIKNEDIQLEQAELQSAVAQSLYGMGNPNNRNSLPRGVTKGDMVNAATYEMANRLLSRNLMRKLKSIASGEPEEANDVPDMLISEQDDIAAVESEQVIDAEDSNEMPVEVEAEVETVEESESQEENTEKDE